ncbi:transcription initiation factor tfiid subunit tsm1 [Bipolaris maydis]|nr:transcription initiation factor tfiid subunit tsm1 [Bipolaris maydis]
MFLTSLLLTPYTILLLPVLFYLLPYLRNWQIRDIPAPFPAAWTNLWLLYQCRRGKRFLAVHEAHKKLGKLVRIQPHHVSIADADAITQVYGHGNGFLKSEYYDAFVSIRRGLFNTRDRAEHTRKRKTVAHTFSAKSVLQFEQYIHHNLQELQNQWDRRADGAKNNGGWYNMDALHWFNYLAFDVIGDLAFGEPFGMLKKGRDEAEVAKDGKITYAPAIEVLNRRGEVSGTVGIFPAIKPYAKYFPDPFFSQGMKAIENLAGIAIARVNARLEKPSDRVDLLARLMEGRDETGNKLGREELTAEALTQLIAGSDTTSNTSCALLYHCLKHPEVVKKLQKELDTALPDPDAVPSYAQVKDLPYLDAVIKEAMRIHSTSSLGLPRVIPPGPGITILGHHFPQGTVLSVPAYTIHHSTEIWGPDADTFRPERWESLTEKQKAAFIPFSYGPRACVGRNVAEMELALIVATVFRRYEFELRQEEMETREGFLRKPLGLEPGLPAPPMMAPLELADAMDDASSGDSFTLLKQQLELDFSFAPRRVKGLTTLDIQPDQAQLRDITLNCRQLRPTSIRIQGEKAAFSYSNLHQRLTLYPGTGLEQYHFVKQRIARHTSGAEDELVITVPDKVRIREVKPSEAGMTDDAPGTFYAPLKLEIEYELDDFRDALHFVGVEDGDARFPHAYTRNSSFPGTASCLFPCIDDGETRCIFEVSIRYPRTLGDALSKPSPPNANPNVPLADGVDKADSVMLDVDDEQADLSEEEKAMEMQVICSGTLTDDILDPADPARKTASFSCDTPVLPQHIGFVIGPFEHRLGENAIKVHAFCLPGKENEVRNSAMMLARALDTFTERFQNDLDCDTAHTASFSICSSRLLFPETVWEPLEHTTRVLVHAVANYWIIVGELFGRNDWRFRQKLMVDKQLAEHMQLDPREAEFMELKSLMVLSILHNRLVKQSGKNGVDRCLYRMLFNARQGKYPNGAKWIIGAGCPTFHCVPSFNKKKQVVQLTIKQLQADSSITTIENAKQKSRDLRSATGYPTFVGPMTIRIHEADGTPYEHIVDINSNNVKVEIPNRLNKERMAAAADVTFYMLGDLFTSPQEHEEWRLDDWPPEDEAKQEDFEWICRTNIEDMPSYMYVSQLQQDKDVVAQAESIQFLANKEGHPLISTFLVKTLMDNRYFHGIRTMAAMWLFCLPNSPMTRSNDFSDRSMYLIQCAIPRAIAKIKGEDGRSPLEAKRFLLDLVRYNDNRGNDYSDDHYIATLMRCLAETLTKTNISSELSHEEWAQEQDFTNKAIGELTRHQRLDEWIPTYQNLVTSRYAQLGNADNVRLKAWECLIRLGMFRKDSVMRFLVHEIRSDPSPYFRKQMLRILGLAIGQVATGDVWAPEKAAETAADTLVVENEASNAERASALARQNLNGALRGLKSDLQGHQTLRSVLEEALKSTTLSVNDMSEILDICDMIFDNQKVNKLPVKLALPRYWTVEHLGKAVLRFKQTKKYRTTPKRPLVAPAPAPAPVLPVAPPLPLREPVAPVVKPTGQPKLSLKIGGLLKNKSASSPPTAVDSTHAKSRSQSMVFSPTVHYSPSPISQSTRPSPAPQPQPQSKPQSQPQSQSQSQPQSQSQSESQSQPQSQSQPSQPADASVPTSAQPDSRASTPEIPLMQQPMKKVSTPAATPKVGTPAPVPATAPTAASVPAPKIVTKTPVPPPRVSVPAPKSASVQSKPAMGSVKIPKSVSTPTMSSPVPLPAPKLKIKTKTANGSTVTSRPSSAAPSPRPSAAPSPRPTVVPPPRPTASVPGPVARPVIKQKRSKIVKLRLAPRLLSRFTGDTKKRKLILGNGGNDDDRPLKRQSLETGVRVNGGNGTPKSGLVSVERGGSDRPRLVVKMKLGKSKLPVERKW